MYQSWKIVFKGKKNEFYYKNKTNYISMLRFILW